LIQGFSPLKINPPPLGGYQADMCLDAAERIDGYQSKIRASPMNMKARAGQSYQPVDQGNTVAIPIEDAVAPWWSGQVLWMNSSADAGFPHTRPPYYICLPSNISLGTLSSTLLHERVHLHQRIYPEIWTDFFKTKWDMKVWSGRLPSAIEAKHRLNPDLLQVPFYVWKDKWVSLCLFNDTGIPSLGNSSTAWFNVEQKVISKTAPDGWYDFFGKVPDDEHPWEIAAYYIADKSLSAPAKDALMKIVPTLPKTFLSS
jgi:hypothetical protein